MTTPGSKNIRIVISLTLLMGLHCLVSGQIVRRQVQIAVRIKGSKPKQEEKEAAIRAAKVEIIRMHIQSSDSARHANLKGIEPQLVANPDGFLSNFNILGDDTDRKSKTYTVAVVADVNEAEINRILAVQAPQTHKLPISMVVVSRRQTLVKEIGPKVATGSTEMKTTEDSTAQTTTAGKSSVVQASKTQTAAFTESAVTLSSDSIIYDVASAQEVDAAISGVLGDRGFKVVPADTLTEMTGGLFDVKRLIRDFRMGNDIAPETKRDAVKGCQKVEMPFFGYGTLTIGVKQKDDVSGKWKVNVLIVAEVWDVREKFASKVAAVGPVQYQDIGDSQTQAENNALTGAANRAAQLVSDKLLEKGIR